MVNVEGRQLMCICRGCYLLFTDSHAQLRYRAVPDRYLAFPDFALDRREWEALQIPVGLAFFFRNSAHGPNRRVLSRPGRRHRVRTGPRRLERDHRRRPPGRACWPTTSRRCWSGCPTDEQAPPQCFLVPIDACYEFVGRLRMLWRGFDGGQEAHRFIDEFFAQVEARSQTVAGGDAP